ncbi:WD repeat-containing protein 19 [Chytridiales sp. JEL 0842]|nr:WD repeat-containing protein 19 [Chytridiales sp. JEL 0842]
MNKSRCNFLATAGPCSSMEWTPNGEILTVVVESSPLLYTWDANQRRSTTPIDTNMKGLSCLAWNSSSEILAVGTTKGNLLIFNRRTLKKVPVLGKHSKAILSVAWSEENVLACTSADQTFTLTNLEGDTTFQLSLKGHPSHLKWLPASSRSKSSQTLAMLLNQCSLLLYTPSNPPTAPLELAFQEKYGNITNFTPTASDTQLFLGFSNGYLVLVSTDPQRVGQELFQSRPQKDSLTALSLSAGKLATLGPSVLKIHDPEDPKELLSIVAVEDSQGGQLQVLEWAEDGGLVTLGSSNGKVLTYLTKISLLGSGFGGVVGRVSGVKEVTVSSIQQSALGDSEEAEATWSFKKPLEFDPTIVAVGPNHWVAGAEHHLTFFSGGWPKPPSSTGWGRVGPGFVAAGGMIGAPSTSNKKSSSKGGDIILAKEYPGDILSVSLSKTHACVLLSDGRVQVHPLPDPSSDSRKRSTIPSSEIITRGGQKDGGIKFTCAFILNELFVGATTEGDIRYYTTDTGTLVSEYRHQRPILSLVPKQGSTRLIFIDDVNDAFVYSPTDPITGFNIPNVSAKLKGILWETPSPTCVADRCIFVAWDDAFVTTYAFQPLTFKAKPQCLSLGTTKLPSGTLPLLFTAGSLHCLTASGTLTTLPLSTHEIPTPTKIASMQELQLGKIMQGLYTLGLLDELWALINVVTSRKAWTMVAEAALRVLDLEVGKRVYRQILHDPAMSMTLSTLLSSSEGEDLLSLSGHVACIFGDFELAQSHFLGSAYPLAALEMRKDLGQWEAALALAEKLDAGQVTLLAKEFANQLEGQGKYVDALAYFDKALETSEGFPLTTEDAEEKKEEHQIACSSGMTRMTFRMGDVGRGIKMLQGVEDPKLLTACAAIVESLKMYAESGSLYERAKEWERACEVYIRAKMWDKAKPLLDKVTAPKIFLQYAKAMEASKDYAGAAAAYERGRDYENLVRILVEHLKDVEKAVRVVRETRSIESARCVSRFFLAMGDFKAVVEFYLMAGMLNEAFELAQNKGVMEHFAELVKEEASVEMLNTIATYFESNSQPYLAGLYLLRAKAYPQALRMFMRAPILDGKPVEKAIETVGLAQNDALTHELIDYLMGETDGVPKEAKYIFKLYMSLGSYKDAARTAVIIAREEQTLGNYRVAHDLLLDNHLQLQKVQAKIPSDLTRMLMLLHSYLLVKTLIRMENHTLGARMLIRVSNNISRFPAHVVPILTSTVIECHRAGLRKEAFEWASTLMRPEYRPLVDAKFKRKIEQIVRRPEKDEASVPREDEKVTPCPFCSCPVPETVLDCNECKNHLPYCIATGKHMTIQDWSTCPSCQFPALYKDFKELVAKTSQCPMCAASVDPSKIALSPNPQDLLRGTKDGGDAATNHANGSKATSNGSLGMNSDGAGVWGPGGLGATGGNGKGGGLVAVAAV